MRKSPCIACGQIIPKKLIEEFEAKRVREIKAALAMAKSLGEPVGRPRSIDYEKVKELRAKGYSIAKIAAALCTSERTVSRGAVQHALKEAP